MTDVAVPSSGAAPPKADSINRGTLAILISQVLALGLTWGGQLLIANHPAIKAASGEYYNYQIILSVVMLLTHLIHYGLPSAVGKYVAEDPAFAGYFLSRGWRLQMNFVWALLGIALVLAPFIVLFVIRDPAYFGPYAIAMISVPAYAWFNQRTSVMGGLRLFTAESKIYAVYAVVRFVGIVLAVWLLGDWIATLAPARIRAMISGALFAPTLAALVGFTLAWKATQFPLGYKEKPDMDAEIIRFVLPNIAIIFMLQLLMRLDLLAVQLFAGATSTWGGMSFAALMPSVPHPEWGDYYAGGNNLANLFFTLGASMYATTYPTIAAMRAQGNDAAARAIMMNSMRALILVGMPVIALFAGGTKEAMDLLFPPTATANYASIGNALPILAAATVLQTVYMNLIVAVVAGGEQPKVVRNLLLMILPGIGYNALFAWLFTATSVSGSGMLAAACAAFCTALHGSVGLGIVANRQFGGLLDPLVLLKSAMASLAVYGTLRLLPDTGFWLIPAALLGLVLYVGLLLALKTFSPAELTRIASKLDRLKRRISRPPEPTGADSGS